MENDDIKIEHIQFIDLYMKKGYSATKAYQEVYKCSYANAMSCASRLLTNAKVCFLIEEKKKEMMEELGIDTMTQLKELEVLKGLAKKDKKYNDAIKSIEVQNRMLGLNAADKLDIKTSVEQPLFGKKKDD